jgi:two-component system OmpR family sensor kinase
MTTIRKRLLLWLLSALVVTVTVTSAIIYFMAQGELDDLFDYQLRQLALTLQHHGHFPPLENSRKPSAEEADYLVQVWNSEGTLLYSSQPAVKLPPTFTSGYRFETWKGDRWRVFTLVRGSEIIQVSESMDEREELSAGITLSNLIPDLAMVAVLALLIWVAVGWGLRPLTRIAASLDRRHSGALEPLPAEDLPGEIVPLVRALNDLLRRLDKALKSQRRFVADAAHELRTPLTAVTLQAQLLSRAVTAEERKEAYRRVREGLDRATHLVQQLLTMARMEPEAWKKSFQEVSLGEVARKVVGDFAQQAAEKGIDLGLAREETISVPGDPDSLRILLENLVDNAVRYTPPPGRVDVSVRRKGEDVLLEVMDTGPGIPPEARERVFDRFYRRRGTNVSGSGLGLALVRGIAERHQARVSLEDGEEGKGLKVTVRFRRG